MQTELVKFDQLKGKIATMLQPLGGLVVRDKTENAAAAGALTTVKGLSKEIEALRVAAVTPLNDQVKAINARAKEILGPLETAEADIKGKMRVFADTETRRINEERRISEEKSAAERREQEERRRREEAEAQAKAKAERDRVENERVAADKAEAERKRAEAAFGVDEDAEAEKQRAEQARVNREREIREIEERQKKEKQDAADRMRRETEATEARRKADEKRLAAQKPANTRTVWHFEVIEADRLEVPMDYWKIDESAIGAAVRGGLREIPGVKIWSTQEVVARA